KGLQKLFPIFESEKGIVEMNLGNPRQGAENNVLDARLGCSGHSDGFAVAAEASGDPENIQFRDRNLGPASICGSRHSHSPLGQTKWAPLACLKKEQRCSHRDNPIVPMRRLRVLYRVPLSR